MRTLPLLDQAMLWIARFSVFYFFVIGGLLIYKTFAPQPDDSPTMTLHWSSLSEGLLDLATALLWAACLWFLPNMIARCLLGITAAIHFFSASSGFVFIATDPDESNPLWAYSDAATHLLGSISVIWLALRAGHLLYRPR